MKFNWSAYYFCLTECVYIALIFFLAYAPCGDKRRHLPSRVRVQVFYYLLSTKFNSKHKHKKSRIEKIDKYKGIFNNPHRANIMDTEIAKKCCNISNQNRLAVRTSFMLIFKFYEDYEIKSLTLGDECINLDEAILELVKKFLLGGSMKITHKHKIWVTILASILNLFAYESGFHFKLVCRGDLPEKILMH